MTKRNKDTDKLKSPDIRKNQINNTKIIYKDNNKNRLQNVKTITMKNKNSTCSRSVMVKALHCGIVENGFEL